MRDLRGKKVLITGAASGIGRALAVRLAREGADLFLLDIDEAGLAEVVATVRQLGVEAIGRCCDLSQPQQITASVQALLERWRTLDVLVNNAGVTWYGPTLKMTGEEWDRLLAVNFEAPLLLTRELLPVLASRPEAHVLNVASICGLVAGGRYAAYTVSKFALVGLSEALRAEFNRRGLGVTAVCPGPVTTALFENAPSGHREKGTPVPPRWVCATPERVADKAVRGLQRNQRLVLVTPLAYLLYHAQRWAPWLLDLFNGAGRRRKIRRKLRKQSDQRDRKAA